MGGVLLAQHPDTQTEGGHAHLAQRRAVVLRLLLFLLLARGFGLRLRALHGRLQETSRPLFPWEANVKTVKT